MLLSLSLFAAACTTAQTPAMDRPVGLEVEPALVQPSGEMVERPRNVILMIADGFGPASATMGAEAKGAPLAFDSLLVGSVETSATDNRVTDSAASATAYACGIKTYNGAIAMTPDGD
ncbi:alkaline phosphatase, partial [Rubrivirga sp.]|uniref:alkaline phosphatase n=1 Tax=Rubrivirga sp. TaxID=1885344 RepID=UPI003C7862A6